MQAENRLFLTVTGSVNCLVLVTFKSKTFVDGRPTKSGFQVTKSDGQ